MLGQISELEPQFFTAFIFTYFTHKARLIVNYPIPELDLMHGQLQIRTETLRQICRKNKRPIFVHSHYCHHAGHRFQASVILSSFISKTIFYCCRCHLLSSTGLGSELLGRYLQSLFLLHSQAHFSHTCLGGAC